MARFIPIQQAIEEGRKRTLPARVLLITGTLLLIGPLTILVLIIANYSKDSLNMLLVFAGIVLLTFLLFIYLPFRFWRKRLLDWQAWAYTNCGDIKELKRSARLSALDFDDSLLGRWLHIELPNGQAQHAQFTDDPDVPAQTIIGISWGHLIFNLIVQTVFIGIGIAMCVYVPKTASSFLYLIAGILIAGMLYAMYSYIRDMLIRRPHLIISNQGIQTVQTGFHRWSEIRDEKIMIRRTRSARVEILVYHFPGGTENLALTPYAISQRQIERLLYVYRNRNKLQ